MILTRPVHISSTAASVVLPAGISLSQVVTSKSSVERRARISTIAKLQTAPLSAPVSTENMGQFDPRVKFQLRIGVQTGWLTPQRNYLWRNPLALCGGPRDERCHNPSRQRSRRPHRSTESRNHDLSTDLCFLRIFARSMSGYRLTPMNIGACTIC